MRTKAPSLPEVDAGAMANLRTLGQIVGYLRDQKILVPFQTAGGVV